MLLVQSEFLELQDTPEEVEEVLITYNEDQVYEYLEDYLYTVDKEKEQYGNENLHLYG